MEETLETYLKKHKITFNEHKHPAVFTVAESNALNLNLHCMHTKSLFLKDDKNNFYLICMNANNRLNTKLIEKELKIKKITFASAEELKNNLHLTPGSVSIFGLVHSQLVNLILDKEIWESDSVGFHPNINTSTLELSHSELERFYNSLKNNKRILKLE